jgi:pimeloyl-ACP methyl ester carboxylesterase
MTPEPFEVSIPESALTDLRGRLALTRWPTPIPAEGWELGSELATMRRLVSRWSGAYDWREQERSMNELPQFRVELDGAFVHFLHYRCEESGALPIVLTHGWPGSFLELTALAERLSRPGAHGAHHDVSFDVVVPSLPGFGFSDQRPGRTDPWSTPELWHRLMIDVLGYERYGAHGGDLGAGVTARLAARHPEAVAGIHLLAVGYPDLGDASSLTADERAYIRQLEQWERDEGAYQHAQATRPLTLAYGLSDSPVGLLAWLVEKLRAWSDSGGDISTRFADDDVLTWVSLYWLTNTIAPSFRPYNDHYARGTATPQVSVPTSVAVFPHDLAQPPREWVERSYALTRYTRMPRGGHFAAFEEPALLAADIAAFFTDLARQESAAGQAAR